MAEIQDKTLEVQTPLEGGELLEAETSMQAEAPIQPEEPTRPASVRAPQVGRRVLTISVDGPLVRAVAFSGRTIAAWTTIDLNGGGALELPEEFTKFLGRRSKQVTDLPFYSPLVRFLERPAVRKRYMGQVVETEIAAQIPFAMDEVDLQWTSLKNGHGPEIMATATPKWEVDSHVETIQGAGASPTSAFTKAQALALGVGILNVVVAHLSAGFVELVLVREGLPRSVHRSHLPPAGPDGGAYASAIRQTVDELLAFERPLTSIHLGDTPPDLEANADDDSSPIVLTGALPTEKQALDAMTEEFGDRIVELTEYQGYPVEFSSAEYAANIGLAMAARRSSRVSWRRDTVEQTLVNLLPERYQRSRVSTKALGWVALLAVLAAGAVGLTGVAADSSASAGTLEAQVSRLERQVNVSRNQAARVISIRAELPVIAGQIEAVDRQIEVQAEELSLLLERLRLLTTDSPLRQVRVLGAKFTDGRVELQATAPSNSLAVTWVEALRQSDLFATAETMSVSLSEGSSRVTFDVDATF